MSRRTGWPRRLECRSNSVTGSGGCFVSRVPDRDSPTSSPLLAALGYAKLGLRPVPTALLDSSGVCSCGCADPCCRDRGKHSLAATADRWGGIVEEAEIRSWWGQDSQVNVGLACGPSGLVVLDVDPKRGGAASMARLSAVHGTSFTESLTAQTSNGGYHLYYLSPPGLRIPTQRSRLGPGIDVIGWGLCVVAPPSVHPSGHHYRWSARGGPELCPPAPMPRWLVEELQRQPSLRYRLMSVRWKIPNLEIRCRLRRLARQLRDSPATGG